MKKEKGVVEEEVRDWYSEYIHQLAVLILAGHSSLRLWIVVCINRRRNAAPQSVAVF
jgi:hypothetical protein